jgi:hypothetical protein
MSLHCANGRDVPTMDVYHGDWHFRLVSNSRLIQCSN